MVSIRPTLNARVITRAVRQALDEDILGGDLTADACVPFDHVGVAEIKARETLILSGMPIAHEVFAQIGHVDVKTLVQDGSQLQSGEVAGTLSGLTRNILLGERVMLNFIQRMSGTATLTRRYVDALADGCSTRITDTRKTTPGLRSLQRYAVRCGGGHNHRNDLGSAVMIKDNHIAAVGSISDAIKRAKEYAPHTVRIECEVDSLPQMQEALHAGADVIMLDNFTDEEVRIATQEIGERAIVEASGNITLDRIASLSQIGVDVISSGALTHSAPAVDVGLDWG